jgi:hypothetical protein
MEPDGNARLGWDEKESLPEIDFFISYQARPFIATARDITGEVLNRAARLIPSARRGGTESTLRMRMLQARLDLWRFQCS